MGSAGLGFRSLFGLLVIEMLKNPFFVLLPAVVWGS